ncbi:hypothetical protein [Ascidiimonas sp. W6]|uniref:hypothetical protein n=1 Tax=Ascidiimonas meishanensis TaxID=3128903 RepID=UPI0030EDF4D4
MDNFQLIEGEFSPAEAKEILLNLFGHKIQFHNLKCFANEEISGKKDKHSAMKVKQLNAMRDDLIDLIKNSEKENKKLVINSVIKIETKD